MSIQRMSRYLLTFSAAVFVVLLSVRIEARPLSEKAGQFVSIPIEMRAQFFAHLKLFVKLQREKLWDQMYDVAIDHLERSSLTKQEFVKSHEDVDVDPDVSTLISFSPRGATLINKWADVKEWLVEGCATYNRRGRVLRLKSGLNAELSNGRWYFSLLTTITQGVDGPEQHCARASETRKIR
jgi:hypothetical protein